MEGSERVKEPFDLGGGDVYVLDTPDAWREIPTALRRVVPPAMREAWSSFPSSFVARAHKARGKGLKRWLEACARGPCRLRVCDTTDFGRGAVLEVRAGTTCLLDFRTHETRTKRYPQTSAENVRPRRVPAALAEVHRAVGGIQFQWGGSGSLVPPDALRTLASHWQDGLPPEPPPGSPPDALTPWRLRGWIAECPNAPAYARAARMGVLYESSGDYLCFDASGRAMWIGRESGGVLPFGSVAEALDTFFDGLLENRRFEHTFVLS